MPGSQSLFLSCPVFELLFDGTRGNGKTDALLMDFLQSVGAGYGAEWRGILFRQNYPALEDVINKSLKWIPRIFPGAKYNYSSHVWTFPDGEKLYFRFADRLSDYNSYHGHAYPWIGWEELTNWRTDELYLKMMSCCRSSVPGIPRHYRATTNPLGIGHGWVKKRFVDPAPAGTIIVDEVGRKRVRISGAIEENRFLFENDPDYVRNLEAQPEHVRKAWRYGSWDIVVGGFIDDLYDSSVHVIQPFRVPPTWRVNRSFDWGSSKPYSVGWWAESDGSDFTGSDGRQHSTIPGDLFLISELYGCPKGKENVGLKERTEETCAKIREIDRQLGCNVADGPADTAIFANNAGHSIAQEYADCGINWIRANKGPGSRVQGVTLFRNRMSGALERDDQPGLFIMSHCRQFIRTVPVLQWSDKNPEDVDSDMEDHAFDMAAYRLLQDKPGIVSQGSAGGMLS